jgi:hypothetical protein
VIIVQELALNLSDVDWFRILNARVPRIAPPHLDMKGFEIILGRS